MLTDSTIQKVVIATGAWIHQLHKTACNSVKRIIVKLFNTARIFDSIVKCFHN